MSFKDSVGRKTDTSLDISGTKLPVEHEKAHQVPGISVELESSKKLDGRVTVGDPKLTPVVFDIEGLTSDAVDAYLLSNASEKRRGPDLILKGDVTRRDRISGVYKIEITEAKEAFRSELLGKLKSEWEKLYSPDKVVQLEKAFLTLAQQVEQDGLAAVSSIIPTSDFEHFLEAYTELMEVHGNKTWLHSYVDLRRHPEFLMNSSHNEGFFHPLLIALIAYEMGGPIRLNDARAKDAEPMVAVTLDNMLHIDNVPFTKEFKITQFWQKGEAKGPDGQCFVCLPGTNMTPRAPDGKLVDGKPVPFEKLEADESDTEDLVLYTTEAGSVFRTEEELTGALNAQKDALGIDKPLVLGLRGEEVFTAVAETGSMVHHRYRVQGGNPRSCLLIAFHLIEDDPGRLIAAQKIRESEIKLKQESEVEVSALNKFILGGYPEDKRAINQEFLEVFDKSVAAKSASLLDSFSGRTVSEHKPTVRSPQNLAFSDEEVEEWKASVLHGPGTTAIKDEQKILSLGETMTRDEFIKKTKLLMAYDKAGVLELPLYSDGREEKRKWARNQIRELTLETPDIVASDVSPLSLDARLKDWESYITQPRKEDIKSKAELAAHARELQQIAQKLMNSNVFPTDELNSKIDKKDILPSIHQLIHDLAVAIENTSNSECFVSTGLFIFWACDTLKRVIPRSELDPKLEEIGAELLKHYVSMLATLEIQKQHA